MDIKEQIHGLSEEMIENLGKLVAIDSQLAEAKEGKPFGEGPAEALRVGLEIAEGLGFRTVNLDNYCGYAEMGEGDEIVGIAGHLDVVPTGGDWTYDPFTLTRDGDYIYGRGTTDDKGPVIEALYAMKLLRDSGVKLNKRVRLIMGCNEETGSKCMEHYNEVEEELSCGFTPDASYPCIHGEKGHMEMMAYSKHTRIISMNGGFVSNAVCDSCTTVIPAKDGLKDRLEKVLAETDLQEYKVSREGDRITIFAKGVPAHASTPTLGVNAAAVTCQSLAEAGFEDDFVTFYNSHLGTACDGAGVGLKFADEYGDLTFCNGIVKTEVSFPAPSISVCL
jgi:succinyl-diaminopimelate desuccinylase